MSGTNYRFIKEATLDLLFPRRCVVCQKPVGKEGICPACEKKIGYIKENYCCSCGRPLQGDTEEYCGDCRKHPKAFSAGRALCLYKNEVKKSVMAVKNHNRREYLDFFADRIETHLGDVIEAWDPEVLLPIPMYPRDKRKRGFNQAEELAKRLGERLELPVDTKILKKCRKTLHQKELSQQERKTNMRGAFSVEIPLPWKRILLVDDIYTTGSTLHEAAKTLRTAGAEEVFFVVICTAPYM